MSAIAAYQEAIRLLPGSTAAHRDLGLALYRAGRWAEAITALETARKLRKGDDGRDGFVLAMAHWRQGDRDEARAWFDKAVQAMQREIHGRRTDAVANGGGGTAGSRRPVCGRARSEGEQAKCVPGSKRSDVLVWGRRGFADSAPGTTRHSGCPGIRTLNPTSPRHRPPASLRDQRHFRKRVRESHRKAQPQKQKT